MTWHVGNDAARRYAERQVDATGAASIEAHLEHCGECRTVVSGAIDPIVLASLWSEIDDVLDRPTVGWLETLLRRAGCSNATARVVAVTSRARRAYLVAVAISLALAVLASRSSDSQLFGIFLMVAPLGPLMATAVAFGRWSDRAADLVTTVPMSSVRLLLVRTATAVVPAVLLTATSLPWLANRGVVAIGWLLPSLALALGAVALSSWMSVEVAAGALGALWVTFPLALRLQFDDLADLFDARAQVVSVSVAIGAVVVTAIRHTTFEYRES